MTAHEEGLHEKYRVTKASDGSSVRDCFVLRPNTDRHARAALTAYADSVESENSALAFDLRAWLRHLNRPREFYPTHGEMGDPS